MTLPWRLTKDELPVDDAEVIAAVHWRNNEYGIHDCSLWRGGPGPEQAIFSSKRDGQEFTPKQVHCWMYKTDLAASVPSASEVPTERTTSEKIASLKAALDRIGKKYEIKDWALTLSTPELKLIVANNIEIAAEEMELLLLGAFSKAVKHDPCRSTEFGELPCEEIEKEKEFAK